MTYILYSMNNYKKLKKRRTIHQRLRIVRRAAYSVFKLRLYSLGDLPVIRLKVFEKYSGF